MNDELDKNMPAIEPIIVANWKMNKTIDQAVSFAYDLGLLLDGSFGRRVVIAPPYTALCQVAEAIAGSFIELAAQNVNDNGSGAFTGEVSAEMLADLGCRYVIIGHSERRHIYGETDRLVRAKIIQAFAYNLRPIMCVGETEQERNKGKALDVLQTQICGGLDGIDNNFFKSLIIAYEPVWAIGTGNTASPEQAEEAHAFIRQTVNEHFNGTGNHLPIIYGGSVKPDNIKSLMEQPNINGALVGGASLDAKSFAKIVLY